MRWKVGAVALLLIIGIPGIGGADVMRFKCDELTINPGQADSVVYTYYDSSYCGMVTICHSKPDSSIGRRPYAVANAVHATGLLSRAAFGIWDLAGGDTARVLLKMDLSAVPDSALVTEAILFLYDAGHAFYNYPIFIAVDPVYFDKDWIMPSNIGGGRSQAFGPAGGGPSWVNLDESGPVPWSLHGADSLQGQTFPRSYEDRQTMGTGMVVSQTISGATGYVPIDITSLFHTPYRDSVDFANAGFLIHLDNNVGIAQGTYMKIADHLCEDTAKRPKVRVTYYDTTEVTTYPIHLGMDGAQIPRTQPRFNMRDSWGKIGLIADTHADGDCCGGVGGSDNWRTARMVIEQLIAQGCTHIFHVGDWCLNPKCGNADSVLAMHQIAIDAGVILRSVVGNWEHDNDDVPRAFGYARTILPPLYGRRYWAMDLGFVFVVGLNNNTGFPFGLHHAGAGCVEDSLNAYDSRQWLWLNRVLSERRQGQPLVVLAHKNYASVEFGRTNLRDENGMAGAADSLCRLIELAGAWVMVNGHDHNYTRAWPLYHGTGAIIKRGDLPDQAGEGQVVQCAAGDSTTIFLTVGLPWAATPSAAEIATGRYARWGNGWEPYGVVLEFWGDHWSIEPVDTTGAQLDTCLVVRR